MIAHERCEAPASLPSIDPARASCSSVWRYLIALVILGVVVRLLVAPLGDFTSDATTFQSWAERLVQAPLAEFYAAGRNVDHLPGDLWLLWGLARLYRALGPLAGSLGLSFPFALKLVPILADTGIGLALFGIGRRLAGPRAGLVAAAFILLNPASIYLTAIWGQWDAVSVFVLVVALGVLVGASPAWSWPLLTYASLVKPQMALFLPLALLASWRWTENGDGQGRIIRWLRSDVGPGLASVGVFLAVDLPFDVGLPPLPTRWTILERVQVAWNAFDGVSVNAYNLWELVVGPTARNVPDRQPFLLGISYQTWGTGLLAGVVLVALARFWLRPTRLMAIWSALTIALALFVLPTRIHERYLLPAVVLAALLAAIVPAFRWIGAALSLTYLVNLYEVYASDNRGFGPASFGPGGFRPGFGPSGFGSPGIPPSGSHADLIVLIVSAIDVAMLLAVLGMGLIAVRGSWAGPNPLAPFPCAGRGS